MERYLNIIAKHSNRLNAIIEDLLSLSRLEQEGERREITFEKVKLEPVLAAAIELSDTKAKEKKINVNLTCPDDIIIKINSALLEQAVLNLIDNAIKYSPPESTVRVSAEKNEKEISITVQDSGPGIGLGLAIVKHIAQVHKGYVLVKSSPETGSKFTIYLPVD